MFWFTYLREIISNFPVVPVLSICLVIEPSHCDLHLFSITQRHFENKQKDNASAVQFVSVLLLQTFVAVRLVVSNCWRAARKRVRFTSMVSRGEDVHVAASLDVAMRNPQI